MEDVVVLAGALSDAAQDLTVEAFVLGQENDQWIVPQGVEDLADEDFARQHRNVRVRGAAALEDASDVDVPDAVGVGFAGDLAALPGGGALVAAQGDLALVVLEVEADDVVAVLAVGAVVARGGGDADVAVGQWGDPGVVLVAVEVDVEEALDVASEPGLGVAEPAEGMVDEADAGVGTVELRLQGGELEVAAEPQAPAVVAVARPGGIEPGDGHVETADVPPADVGQPFGIGEQVIVAGPLQEVAVGRETRHGAPPALVRVALPEQVVNGGGVPALASLVEPLGVVGFDRRAVDVVVAGDEKDVLALDVAGFADVLEEASGGVEFVAASGEGGVAGEEEKVGMKLVLVAEDPEVVEEGPEDATGVPVGALAGVEVREVKPGQGAVHEAVMVSP